MTVHGFHAVMETATTEGPNIISNVACYEHISTNGTEKLDFKLVTVVLMPYYLCRDLPTKPSQVAVEA